MKRKVIEEPKEPKDLEPGSDGSENELSIRESDSEDSDAELEKLLGQEEDVELDSDFSADDEDEDDVDPRILKELQGVRVRSASDDEEEEVLPGFTKTIGADGNPRLLRPEIDPIYDSDDSDLEEANTIGNIPLSAYNQMPHIGYTIDGKRIMRPATASALDTLLETIDVPEGWTGLLDQGTGTNLKLTKAELDLIKTLSRGENADGSMNPFEDTVEWFTSQTEQMPLTAVPEPKKRRFVPSKHEAKRVMKIVRAIREGRIVPNKPKPSDDDEVAVYDIWANTNDNITADHVMTLRAPKLPPPTHEESYNPPAEYLLDDEERQRWEAMDPSERETNFMPKKYNSLRQVPGYSESVRERFERSLDLYLAPRVRHKKLDIDPDSLIPNLPSPQDLRPFPIKCSTIYRGHVGRVRSVSVHKSGLFLATGGDDGTVRVWDVLTGRELWKLNVIKKDSYDKAEDDDGEEDRTQAEDHVECVQWNPSGNGLLAVSAGESVYLLVPPVFDGAVENASRESIEAGWGYASAASQKAKAKDAADNDDDDDDEAVSSKPKKVHATWMTPVPQLAEANVGAVVRCKKTVKKLAWHAKGDYFVTVAPQGGNTSVLVHQLSKHATQSPFKKSKGIVQDAQFHPFRPHLYVATQRYIRIYDLQGQTLVKKLMPGVRWLSSFDIHPLGENVITSSYDKRLTWHDLDLSTKPYKTLRYHTQAVRDVSYHKGGLPLFCSASDDGTVNVFHGTVYDDLMQNPLLVPLKVLKGHTIKSNLGVLSTVWHPKEAWLFTSGADGTARLWTT